MSHVRVSVENGFEQSRSDALTLLFGKNKNNLAGESWALYMTANGKTDMKALPEPQIFHEEVVPPQNDMQRGKMYIVQKGNKTTKQIIQ